MRPAQRQRRVCQKCTGLCVVGPDRDRSLICFNRPLELTPEDVNIPDLVGEVLDLLEPEARSKGIDIVFESPSESIPVKADSGLLRQKADAASRRD